MADAELTPDQRVALARLRLAANLDAIEDKFNVPKRARAASKRIKASYRRNPAPWIAGAIGVAAVIAGGIAWAVTRRR
ncbi:MAG TPA: DUF3618 domain-containing protein [Microbacteriaceae bacterium]|nr:DUF3618 domain-containing protein [Microbacteriaceae bacterium]